MPPNFVAMPRKEITIRNATVVQTGVDGGHSYLQGNCEYTGQTVPVTALMADKVEESALHSGVLVVSYESLDYTRGAGLLLSNCLLSRAA